MRQKTPARLLRLPRRLVLRRNETSSDALLRLLRRVARAGRAARDQTFYSLREIANQYRLPLSLVSRVFARLETEGLLGRVRGSRTVLHGRKFDRHLYVRGVVGIPVSIFRFSAFAGYRSFVTSLRRKLRRHGFMPAAIFYEQAENRGNFLAQSLLEARADVVVWFSPRRDSRETIAALHDAGVRVIGVSDSMASAVPCRYWIEREAALRAVLREWRAAGITSSVVVTAERGASPADEESYRLISEEQTLPSEIVTLKEVDPQPVLRRIWRTQKCGILLTRSAAAFLASRQPEIFARLTKKGRVALVEGPVSVSFATIHDGTIDLIAVDWEKVADRIVADLINQTVWSVSERVTFQAKCRLRVALSRCCHQL